MAEKPSDLERGRYILAVGEVPRVEAHSVERKLAAIFAADVEGYSRLMGINEVGTLHTLTAYRVIADRLIAAHRGRIFNTAGDSVLAEFASAVDAVRCAIDVQEAIAKENAARLAAEQMWFRVGIHVGDIIVQGDNLFGDGVNIAARLEALAEPGGIRVSGTVRDQIGTKLPLSFTGLGEQQVKNIAQPIKAYRIRGDTSPTDAPVPSTSLPEARYSPLAKPRGSESRFLHIVAMRGAGRCPNFIKPFAGDPHRIWASWALQLEQPRSLLLPIRLGKLGVRVWSNGFQYRREGLFKRLTLGRGVHLAFQSDRLCELCKRSLVAEPYADRGMDKLMCQHASDAHRIVQDWRDHDLGMPICTVRVRPAFPQPLSVGEEGPNARQPAGEPDVVRDGRAVRGEDRSKPLGDRVQPCLAMFKHIDGH